MGFHNEWAWTGDIFHGPAIDQTIDPHHHQPAPYTFDAKIACSATYGISTHQRAFPLLLGDAALLQGRAPAKYWPISPLGGARSALIPERGICQMTFGKFRRRESRGWSFTVLLRPINAWRSGTVRPIQPRRWRSPPRRCGCSRRRGG